MRPTSVVLCAFLMVLAAASSRAAYGTTGKIIIKAPDPTCSDGAPPAGIEAIAFDGPVANVEGPDVSGGSVPTPVDGSASFAESDFANCTGETIYVLAVTLDDIPANQSYAVQLSGGAFDGSGFSPISSNSVTLFLYCDPEFFGGECNGLSGSGPDNGVSLIVNTPEPTEAPMLLLGVGGMFLLGLSTRKGRKQLRAAGAV
jgi:hypothetical protein